MSDVYQTKQRDIISACMAARPGEYLSAKEIHAICDAEGAPVGLTAIYRQLERLVREGKAKRIVADGGVCFGWMDSEGHGEVFFLKCDRCGKLARADCGLLREMSAHMSAEHGFRIDAGKSVLYGRCGDC